jgi:cation/acetate symporter
MNIDPYVLTFSALMVGITLAMGFWSAKKSKTASDFFVAGRSVSVGWNASAISGEYLSAASFMGIAGMVMSSGYDALWYPVCYACGYLFLLLFIAGPLRRFGAYTIPDFAEGRFDSPLFRKIAVIFVLFIGFFYTMPQMKGAGTALAYIFPGLPYWAGVAVVGAVITFNVALGGMKGITLVQAFQYWAKMFAISVPIFILMAVYGDYGTHLRANATTTAVGQPFKIVPKEEVIRPTTAATKAPLSRLLTEARKKFEQFQHKNRMQELRRKNTPVMEYNYQSTPAFQVVDDYHYLNGREVFLPVYERHQVDGRIFFFPIDDQSRALITFRTTPGHRLSVAESERAIENAFEEQNLKLIPYEDYAVILAPKSMESAVTNLLSSYALSSIDRKNVPEKAPQDSTWISPFGPLTTKAAKAAHLPPDQTKLLSLLYTYSLIIALVCGTAGLPHILVRFYTNPDGVAAKRTTMWVMVLIGVFYLFPPIFGVLGRNLMPDLYNGVAGVKGTDGVVLKLPKLLNDKWPPLGSILSGITCAGAFAAFMSTFSGLLVSMTGALAHDVYGRILKPQSTPQQRMRMFKVCAIICGAGAVLLGLFVETFEINKMVGWAFAIAATSYFPLLFLSTWWRGITMKGAATGMLCGGLLSLSTVVSTMLADQAAWAKPLSDYYTSHPLLRILAEQPAIWALPLAIVLMVVVSKLTAADVPKNIRMKMLVLHAPEKLGMKQEYIQEAEFGH